MDKTKLYLLRGYNWLHDTLILVGILTVLLFCGGARTFGYYFVIDLIPVELTQVAKK